MQRRTRWLLLLSISLGTIVCLAGVLVSYWRYQYPFGWSHCCDKQLYSVLHDYARTHKGFFPAGEATPEASLSLLAQAEEFDVAYLLRGKTVPESVVTEILDRGDLLGPETCGWHYVEGLTLADDHRLALFWDKAGLDHNGRRLPKGGHMVMFLHGGEYIPGNEWPKFLKEQESLLAARGRAQTDAIPILSAKIRLPSGEIVDHYNGSYTLTHSSKHETGSGSGRSGPGPKLPPEGLVWWQLSEFGMGGVEKGTVTFTLSLDRWTSKPVEIQVSDGKVSPNSIIFEMMADRDAQTPTPIVEDASHE